MIVWRRLTRVGHYAQETETNFFMWLYTKNNNGRRSREIKKEMMLGGLRRWYIWGIMGSVDAELTGPRFEGSHDVQATWQGI